MGLRISADRSSMLEKCKRHPAAPYWLCPVSPLVYIGISSRKYGDLSENARSIDTLGNYHHRKFWEPHGLSVVFNMGGIFDFAGLLRVYCDGTWALDTFG